MLNCIVYLIIAAMAEMCQEDVVKLFTSLTGSTNRAQIQSLR